MTFSGVPIFIVGMQVYDLSGRVVSLTMDAYIILCTLQMEKSTFPPPFPINAGASELFLPRLRSAPLLTDGEFERFPIKQLWLV